MHLASLYLRNFRNYREAEVHFDSKCNLLWGDNAQGKTNLLEAIYLLSTGRSFRTQRLSELIYEGESLFYLEAELIQNGVRQQIKLSFDGENKRLQLNASPHNWLTPLLGTMPLVLHAPSDTDLIEGPPTLRRRFLNLHLAQSDPLYIHHLTRFWRSMKQRNCLLRTKNKDPIECWETIMAQSAAYLNTVRQELIEKIKPPLASHSSELSLGQELCDLRYHPSYDQNYLKQLEKNRNREQELGMTLLGPHRDDLSFWIGNRSAKFFASEGQKKTAVAALRLAEWDRLANRFQSAPIMAIDDLGLPLDPSRQMHFYRKLDTLAQVFITAPTPNIETPAHCIRIKNGSILK